jgi:hypothetical protein
MSDNINLNPREKNLLTEILYDEHRERSKNHMDTRPIDNLIDKALGRVTLYRRNEKVLSLSDGCGTADISVGGVFESEHGRFVVQDIDGSKIKVGGLWYHKSEFEPAIVMQFKGKAQGLDR